MKRLVTIIVWMMIAALPLTAMAAAPPDYSESMGRLNSFMQNVQVVLNNILNDAGLSSFVNAIWVTFTIILLVSVLSRYSLRGITIYELIYPLLLILITRLMLNHYDYLTSLCWDWSEGISAGIQSAVVGSSDPLLLPAFIHDVMAGIETSDVGLWDGIKLLLATNLILGIISLLSILAFLANTWALWGYALSKIIGWFFIPFIMVRKLSYLFDGWVRLFTGFLVYGIIARANLILTVLAVKSFFGIPGYTVNTGTSTRLDFVGIADLLGLAAFLFISILALIATSRFAATVVSGAGGFGESIRTLAGGVASLLKG